MQARTNHVYLLSSHLRRAFEHSLANEPRCLVCVAPAVSTFSRAPPHFIPLQLPNACCDLGDALDGKLSACVKRSGSALELAFVSLLTTPDLGQTMIAEKESDEIECADRKAACTQRMSVIEC